MECVGTQCLTGTARLARSLSITPTRSHVPYNGLNHSLAMYMPEVSRPVKQVPVYLIPKLPTYPGFDSHLRLSTRHPWFTFVRLYDSHLTSFYTCLFPTRSPTTPLKCRSCGWFATSACTGDCEGPALIHCTARNT